MSEFKAGGDSSEVTYVAKTMFGLEDVLCKELESCGAKKIQKGVRMVSFRGNKQMLYKANYCCRTALRILQPLTTFPIKEQKQLYQKGVRIPWERYFGVNNTFVTAATVSNSIFSHSKYASLLLKDAIADRFRDNFSRRPDVDVVDPDVSIDLHISNNQVTISLDSSGKSLHKRGYRTATGPAPLNEVLAAGMILLSEWDAKTPLYDPMCGSGTLLIEAAMIAQRIPAGFFRKKYAFMQWKDFDMQLWENLQRDVAMVGVENDVPIFGSDQSDGMIKIAIQNAKNAHLNQDISFKRRDFFKMKPSTSEGLLIMNPPYDQRLEHEDIDAFYREMGDVFKREFQGFTAWVLSGNLTAIRNIGLKSSRRIELYNGPIETRFSKYDLYAGSKRKASNEPPPVLNEDEQSNVIDDNESRSVEGDQ